MANFCGFSADFCRYIFALLFYWASGGAYSIADVQASAADGDEGKSQQRLMRVEEQNWKIIRISVEN